MKPQTSDIVTLAAEKAFREAINFIVQSKLNHSIYLTPFSAQLSVKRTVDKHYNENKVKIEDDKEHTLAMKVDHFEESLHKMIL